MRTRRLTLIVVISAVLVVAAVVNIRADQPQAYLSPDRILTGTTPTIMIMLDKSILNQEQITSVRIGEHIVAVQKSGVEGKLSFQPPKLDFVGRAEVEVIGKDDKPVAVGHLNYVERSSNGLWLLLLYVFLIVLPPSVFNLYDIYKSYQERSVVLLNLTKNTTATIDEIKALLRDMDQGPTGFTGLTRGIVAVTLILVLAIAVFHLVVFAPPTVPHIVEQLLTLLAGTLTAITGFYFGSKAATEATQATKTSAGKTEVGVVPKITDVLTDPTNNKKLKVIGEGFGEPQGKGTVKLRHMASGKEVEMTVSTWKDKEINVDVTANLITGTQVDIIVTNGNEKSSEPFQFKIK